MQDAVLRDYQEQIARLKAQLEEARSGRPDTAAAAPIHSMHSIEDMVEQEVQRRLQQQVNFSSTHETNRLNQTEIEMNQICKRK